MNPIPTYKQYLELVTKRDIKLDLQQYQQMVQNITFASNFIKRLPFISYIVNFHTHEYLFMSENVKDFSGYSAKEFMEGGLFFTLNKLYYKPDLDVFGTYIFKEILRFYQSLPPDERMLYSFQNNYRFIKSSGELRKLQQQCTILEFDYEGNPLIVFGMCSDITHFKTDNRITLMFSRQNYDGIQMEVVKHYYPDGETALLFTKREKEVLQLISNGLNSMDMANLLNISTHTVKNHRKNLLKKSNTQNTAQLIQYIQNRGIINIL